MAKPVPKPTESEQMIEKYREQVRQEELLARMNKASWEKMHYFIEGAKLVPEYGTLVNEQARLREEQIAKADAAIDQAFAEHQAEAEASESGSLEVTGSSVD